ncbi:hypothetical protein ES703_70675 [subsurface metagenome]
MAAKSAYLGHVIADGHKDVLHVVGQVGQPVGALSPHLKPWLLWQECQRCGIIVTGVSIGSIGNAGFTAAASGSAGGNQQEYG